MKKRHFDIPPSRDRKKERQKYFTSFYRSRWVTTYTEDHPKKPTKYVVFMWSFMLVFFILGIIFLSNAGSIGAGIFAVILSALFFFVGLGFIRQWKKYRNSDDSNSTRKQ